MIKYALKRILWLIPVIIGVSFLIFALMDIAPGTVVDKMVNESTTPEEYQMLMERYDLDKPMIYRYFKYMWNLCHGDLGISEATGLGVFDQFISKFPNTAILALLGLVIGMGIAIPLGIYAAKHSGTFGDNAATGFSMIGLSMPAFWLCLLLILLFSYKLGWLPSNGFKSWQSLVLPVISNGLAVAATLTRQTRSSMLEVSRQDYLRTARSKGLSEADVTKKHTLRNAWIPIITQLGNTLSHTLAGSAVVETVFTWPGIGRMTVNAVSERDTTTVCGCVILTSIIYVLVLLICDLVFAMVDPRIKAQYTRGKKRKSIRKAVSA